MSSEIAAVPIETALLVSLSGSLHQKYVTDDMIGADCLLAVTLSLLRAREGVLANQWSGYPIINLFKILLLSLVI